MNTTFNSYSHSELMMISSFISTSKKMSTYSQHLSWSEWLMFWGFSTPLGVHWLPYQLGALDTPQTPCCCQGVYWSITMVAGQGGGLWRPSAEGSTLLINYGPVNKRENSNADRIITCLKYVRRWSESQMYCLWTTVWSYTCTFIQNNNCSKLQPAILFSNGYEILLWTVWSGYFYKQSFKLNTVDWNPR